MNSKRRHYYERLSDADRAQTTNVNHTPVDIHTMLTGRDIKTAYTPDDHVKLAVAGLKDAVSWLPFTPHNFKGAKHDTKDAIESRLQVECIRAYSKEFGVLLDEAKLRHNYTRSRLDKYSIDRHTNSAAAFENNQHAKGLDELALTLETEANDLIAGAAQSQDCVALCEDVKNKRIKYDEVRASQTRRLDNITLHTRLSKVYTVLHASMLTQYDVASHMVSVLTERGSYINNMLEDYANGSNIRDLAKWQQRTRSLAVIRDRLLELDKEYRTVARTDVSVNSMPDPELETAHNSALKYYEQRDGLIKERLQKSAAATVTVV